MQRDIFRKGPGICKMCGGRGKYGIYYTYRPPTLRKCLKCKGTGKANVRIKPVNPEDAGADWRENESFRLVSETEDQYTLGTNGGGVTIVNKDEFTIY